MTAVGTRFVKVEIGTEEYSAELTNVRVTSNPSEADTTTFADAAAGGARDWALAFTAVQDHETGSIWDKIWTAAGSTVAITYNPHGNENPSATQPHFTANATISYPDGDFMGGEANASTSAKFTFEAVWPLDAKPTKVTS